MRAFLHRDTLGLKKGGLERVSETKGALLVCSAWVAERWLGVQGSTVALNVHHWGCGVPHSTCPIMFCSIQLFWFYEIVSSGSFSIISAFGWL